MLDPNNEVGRNLQKILALTEDNNRMLKKAERREQWARIFRILYWGFIILTAIGAYYILQPYIDTLKSSFGVVSENIDSLKSTSGDVSEFLKTLGQ